MAVAVVDVEDTEGFRAVPGPTWRLVSIGPGAPLDSHTNRGLGRKADHDYVRSSRRCLKSSGERPKFIAVAVRIEFFRGVTVDDVHFPIGSRVINIAGGDIELAVVIEIADRHAFAAKLRVEHGFLEMDRLAVSRHG